VSVKNPTTHVVLPKQLTVYLRERSAVWQCAYAVDGIWQRMKLATNGFKKSSSNSISKPPSLDTWGIVKKSKLEDDGNSWREQK
jgi:hypothetical protein